MDTDFASSESEFRLALLHAAVACCSVTTSNDGLNLTESDIGGEIGKQTG